MRTGPLSPPIWHLYPRGVRQTENDEGGWQESIRRIQKLQRVSVSATMSNAGLCRIERQERCNSSVVPNLFGIFERNLPFDFSSSITAFFTFGKIAVARSTGPSVMHRAASF